ncbi:MAG TPA: methyltransferase domain-containing protein [Terriglobia bacterium]|nr:methyltransferase domain-containing protein [Terriglobia bacterium]
MTPSNARVEVSTEQPVLYSHQERVNQHFTNDSAFWRKIYHQRDVFAAAHQLRSGIALEWIDALGLPLGSRVLEIGCGAGLMTLALANRGFAVTAMDAVQAMLNETGRLVVSTGVAAKVNTALGDVHQLSLKDNTFAMVIALGVLPWLHSPGSALQEMARVLEPGGCLIVNADNRWRMNYCLDPFRFPALMPVRRRIRRTLEQQGLWREFPAKARSQPHSLREFDAMLAGAGLRNERQKTLGFGPFTFLNCSLLPNSAGMKIHQWIQSLADHQVPVIRSAGSQYLVLARKSSMKSGVAEGMEARAPSALSA